MGLCLKHHVGDKVDVGETTVSFVAIEGRRVQLTRHKLAHPQWVKDGGSITLSNGTTISISRVHPTNLRAYYTAPPEVQICRHSAKNTMTRMDTMDMLAFKEPDSE